MTANQINTSSTGLGPGDRIGNFDVVEQIGEGGMSVVWKGHDRVLGKPVVIKQVSPNLIAGDDQAAEAFRKRFRTEAKLQKQVAGNHPHLVRVYDFIESEKGLFIVMEYVEGQSLEQLLAANRQPMDTRQALGIVAATATALDEIHKRGIVHRDLKPSNILMSADGGLKVSDFGLATLITDQDALSLGSARYMAPELFSSSEADGRADIYSLGMIAYELLAGREQFENAFKLVLRDQRNQALRWMKWHTNSRTKAPPLNQLNPKIPEPLSELIDRMMAKEPPARIGSASDLIAAIRRQVTGEAEADAARISVEAKARAAAQSAAIAGEATAVLPRKSRVPMIAASMAIFWTIVILVMVFAFPNRAEQDEKARYKAAERRYAEARALTETVDPPQYQAAAAIFDELAEQWPGDHKLETGAKARAAEARGHLAKSESRFADAIEHFTEAQSYGVLDHNELTELINDLRTENAIVLIFEQIETLLRQVDDARARRDIDTARQHLRAVSSKIRSDAVRNAQMVDSDRTRLDAYEEKIEFYYNLLDVDVLLEEVSALQAKGEMDEARDRLADAAEEYKDDPRILKELKLLTRDMEYADFIAAAEEAESEGNLSRAITNYRQADAIEPSNTLKDKVASLQSRIALAKGEDAMADGDFVAAKLALADAMKHPGPAKDRAERLLEQIAQRDNFEQLVKLGDAADAAGKPDEAIKHYEAAMALDSDPAVRDKIVRIRVRGYVEVARDALDRQDLAAARDALTKAQDQAPSDPAVRDVHARLNQLEQYLELRDKGDAARAAKDYGTAKRRYREAKGVMPTNEIETRINHTNFEDLRDGAKRYIEDENWTAASANVRVAYQITGLTEAQTDQLAELTAIIKEKDPNSDLDE